MNDAVSVPVERRCFVRRTNRHLTRVVYHAHALHRVFGLPRAQLLLERAGFSPVDAQAILMHKQDRRRQVKRKTT